MERMLKEDYNNIDEEKFVIVSYYFNQYAWGICGVSSSQNIYSPQGGWNTQKEAIQYTKDNNFKRINRKGIDEGYGEVGALVQKHWVVRKKDVYKKLYSIPTVSYKLVK